MPEWKEEIRRRLAGLKLSPVRETEIVEELSQHLDDRYRELLAGGASETEARRAALAELNESELLRRELRRVERQITPEPIVIGTNGRSNMIADLWQDMRYGARVLVKNPGFALIAVFTLALGIGASTAIFSAVNPILFEPLPYPHASRIQVMWDHGPNGSRLDVTFGTYREIVERSHSFDEIAVMRSWQPTLTGSSEPERFDGQRVSASYFSVLGASPAIGQGFDSSDDRTGGPRVAILSDGIWKRRFGGDHAIIGQQITLDDTSYTVIGVMPAEFENVLTPSAHIWTLLQYDASLPSFQSREWGHHLRMVGRLRQGVGTDQARQDLDAIAHSPLPEFVRPPWASIQNGLIVNSLQDDVTSAVRPALLAVLGAVLLVLLIACVNVTNLLLARGAQRRGEFALRVALGAAQTRMIRQLLAESLLLATLGGVIGMAVAEFGVRALVALSPPGLPRASAIGLNGTVFAFGLGITTLIGLIVGLIPAFHASRTDLQIGLKQSSRHTTSGHQLTRRALVVAEVALALVLMVGAGLLLRSLQNLFAISPGFEASHLLTMQVHTSARRFDKDTASRFFAEALESARRVPGVKAAGFTSQLPLSGDADEYGVHFENDDPQVRYSAFRYGVSPGYFEMMGIPLRSGRLLDERDRADAPLAVVISESLAKQRFSDQDPIGQRVHLGPVDGPWHIIIGVVGDVKQASLSAPQADAFYITPEQWREADNVMSLVVRAHGDEAALAPAIRQAIWSVDKNQPIARVATMDDLLARTAAERQFALTLFEMFGLVALVLAATGIYGVLSGSVTERTHEIGVRLALGAQRGDILRMVFKQGIRLAGIGIALGLAGASASTRALQSLLFGISPTDPVSFLAIPLLLMLVALLACWLPARRATRVDPLAALRQE